MDSHSNKPAKGSATRIYELSTHPTPFVTVGALADYWLISRKQLYKQIDARTLPALRLGPRLYRIRTTDAQRFEERARILPDPPRELSPPPVTKVAKGHLGARSRRPVGNKHSA